MKQHNLWRTTLICLLLGNCTALQAKEGWYSGFAMGSNKIDLDTPALDALPGFAPLLPPNITNVSFNDFEDDRVGFVLNGGYRMNANVALNLDFSATYADIRIGYTDEAPNPDRAYRSELDITSYYLTPGVNLIYPVNSKFDVYAKLGVSFILTDIEQREEVEDVVPSPVTSTYSSSIKDWDIAPTIGFGAEWGFGKNWAATFEYTITQFKLQPIASSDYNYTGIDYKTTNILIGLRYNFN